jgi:DNA adenine methylase
VPHVRHWLRTLPKQPTLFVEPFAGGGIISLTVACENLAGRVLMVELDAEVAAVWQVLVAGQGDALARRILAFEMTRTNLYRALDQPATDTLDKAFQTVLKNRTYHGGILAPGSGALKKGEAGKGVASRWYAQTLARRIHQIGLIRHKLQFIHGDAFTVLAEHRENKSAAWFVDPPYTAGKGKRAGNRLYTHHQLDHEALFAQLACVKGQFLATYDNDQDVQELADKNGFHTKPVAMTGTHHNRTWELLISRDVTWVDAD